MARSFFSRPEVGPFSPTSLQLSAQRPWSGPSSTLRRASRLRRRGAETIEFALVLPVFLVLVFGSFDYGLMFFTQFQANALVHASLREGTLITPTEWERGNGGCDECRVASGVAASERLARIGIDVQADALQPDIVPVLGVCALVLRAEIPYTPLVGLFSVPDRYIVSSSLPTQQVTLCDA